MANEKLKRTVTESAKRNLKTFYTYSRIQLYTFLSHDGMMHNPIEYKQANSILGVPTHFYLNKYKWIKFEFKNNQYLHCRIIYPWEDLALEINYPPRSDWINCNLLQFNVIFVSTFPLNIMPTRHKNWKTICVRIHVYIS